MSSNGLAGGADDRAGDLALTVIDPALRSSWRMLAEIWSYRELLLVLVERNILVRYKQTVLGVAWAVVQPLMMMAILSFIFSRLTRMPSDGIPYPVFVLAGLVPWICFASIVSGASNSLINSTTLVHKVYFPRLLLPLAAAGTGLVDFAVAALMLVLFAWAQGYAPGGHLLLLLPALLLGLICAALGAGFFLSALAVSYRDVRFVVPFLVQIWMFATPVIYPSSLIAEGKRWVLHLNPMSGVIEGFRAGFLGLAPDVPAMAVSLASSLVLLVVGTAYFLRAERRFADVI